MIEEKIGKSVRGILYTADYIWNLVGCLDEVVELVHSAKLICYTYNLNGLLEDIHKFENAIIEDWKKMKADEAGEALKKRFSEGFVSER